MLGDGEQSDIVGKMPFVCKPSPSNITVIYNPLQTFIIEVERETKSLPG